MSRSGHATTIIEIVAHSLILEGTDHHRNSISTGTSLYHSGLLHKISLQSVHNVLSNVAYKQTDKQTEHDQKHI